MVVFSDSIVKIITGKPRSSGPITWIHGSFLSVSNDRSSHRRCSVKKKVVLKNSQISQENTTLVLESLFNKSLSLVSFWSLFLTLLKIVRTYF